MTMQQPRSTGSAAHATADRQAHGVRRGHPPPEEARDVPEPRESGESRESREPEISDGGNGDDGSTMNNVSSLSWSFPGSPADVSCSRRWLAVAATEAWGEGDDTDRLVLAYSEIATNAVVHGAGPVRVATRIDPTGARCEIADQSAQLPKTRHATTGDVGGRGLEMVQLTVDQLQVATDPAGKTVSFEIGRRKRR